MWEASTRWRRPERSTPMPHAVNAACVKRSAMLQRIATSVVPQLSFLPQSDAKGTERSSPPTQRLGRRKDADMSSFFRKDLSAERVSPSESSRAGASSPSGSNSTGLARSLPVPDCRRPWAQSNESGVPCAATAQSLRALALERVVFGRRASDPPFETSPRRRNRHRRFCWKPERRMSRMRLHAGVPDASGPCCAQNGEDGSTQHQFSGCLRRLYRII